MGLVSVTTYPVAVPQPAGSGRSGMIKSLVVELKTDDGLSGFGEALSPASPAAAAAIIDDCFAPFLIGADETAIGGLWEKMRAALVPRAAGSGAEAVSAVDIALWDLLGQRLKAPIHVLLGGHRRARLYAYGSFIGWIDDQQAAAQAQRAVAIGFRQIKVKLQPPLTASIARARLMRDVVGGNIGLVADPNAGFDDIEAIQLAHVLAGLGYLWLEEPIDPKNYTGLAAIKRLGLLPIAAGESEFGPLGAFNLVSAGAVNLLQPDVGRVGGITGFVGSVNAAAANGIPFAPHHAGGAIKAAASLHLAAALPGFRVMECSLLRTALHDELTENPVAHPSQLDGDGTIPVPQGPGLGITIDRGALERLTVR